MLRFKPKVGDLVYFRWEDHCSYHGAAWEAVKSIPKRLTPSKCETVGFVIEITRTCITTVAHTTVEKHADGEDGSHIATRMRSAITHGKIIKRFK